MEDTINPKPYERKESLPGCFFFLFFWTTTAQMPDTEEPERVRTTGPEDEEGR